MANFKNTIQCFPLGSRQYERHSLHWLEFWKFQWGTNSFLLLVSFIHMKGINSGEKDVYEEEIKNCQGDPDGGELGMMWVVSFTHPKMENHPLQMIIFKLNLVK